MISILEYLNLKKAGLDRYAYAKLVGFDNPVQELFLYSDLNDLEQSESFENVKTFYRDIKDFEI